jgi:hypothetical protein
MRSNRNPSGSVTRSVGERVGVADGSVGERTMVTKAMVTKLSMPRMPMEWLDAGSWRLPSGKALAEFALQAGFLAPLLLRADGLGKNDLKPGIKPGVAGSVGEARVKQFGKGDSR